MSDKQGFPVNPLDAWGQAIEHPPHQVGGRARGVIENARKRRDQSGQLYPEPGQAVTDPDGTRRDDR